MSEAGTAASPDEEGKGHTGDAHVSGEYRGFCQLPS
jgi:hypothetical protein